jgi:hypothetical protein
MVWLSLPKWTNFKNGSPIECAVGKTSGHFQFALHLIKSYSALSEGVFASDYYV